jgi:hypothetical protein
MSPLTIGDVAADRKNFVPLLAVMIVPLEAENRFELFCFLIKINIAT